MDRSAEIALFHDFYKSIPASSHLAKILAGMDEYIVENIKKDLSVNPLQTNDFLSRKYLELIHENENLKKKNDKYIRIMHDMNKEISENRVRVNKLHYCIQQMQQELIEIYKKNLMGRKYDA